MEDILKKYNFDEKLFETLREDFRTGKFTEKDNVVDGKVEPPGPSEFVNIKGLNAAEKEKCATLGADAVKKAKLGCVILNGGMATRFGGGVKGIVEVYDGKSFLQIKLEQAARAAKKYGVKIPVFLMNSFATSGPTMEHLKKNNYFGLDPLVIHTFDQFIFKRINPDGSDFTQDSPDARIADCYYGPGHGDFHYAFAKSGFLEKFTAAGGEHLWFSNVDNLGATIDEVILGCHISKNAEMTVELAEKYTGDKGGAPAVVDGKIQIVEQFKFPPEFNQDLVNVFNSATYIFKAAALKTTKIAVPRSGAALKKNITLPFYVVQKDVCGKKVIQFERLAGDLSIFLKTNYVVVDREERFIPIKTQEDLAVRRDFFKERFR